MQLCKACVHPKREKVDAMIVSGKPSLRHIAAQFGLSASALVRHRRHIVTALTQAKKARQVTAADTLLTRIECLIERTQDVADEALKEKEFTSALRGLAEVRQLLELLGQLSGELKNSGAGVNVNVGIVATEQRSHEEKHVLTQHAKLAAMSEKEMDAEQIELLRVIVRSMSETERENYKRELLHAFEPQAQTHTLEAEKRFVQ